MIGLPRHLDLRLLIKVIRHPFERQPHRLIAGSFRQFSTLAGSIAQFLGIIDHNEQTKRPFVSCDFLSRSALAIVGWAGPAHARAEQGRCSSAVRREAAALSKLTHARKAPLNGPG